MTKILKANRQKWLITENTCTLELSEHPLHFNFVLLKVMIYWLIRHNFRKNRGLILLLDLCTIGFIKKIYFKHSYMPRIFRFWNTMVRMKSSFTFSASLSQCFVAYHLLGEESPLRSSVHVHGPRDSFIDVNVLELRSGQRDGHFILRIYVMWF